MGVGGLGRSLMSGAAQLLHRDYGWKNKWVTCGGWGGVIPLLLQQWCKMNQWSHQPLNSRLRSKTPIEKKGGRGVDVEDCERNESRSIEPICLWFCLLKVLPVNQWLSAAYLAGSRTQTPVYQFARLICIFPSKERRKERKTERKNEGRANKPNVRSTREKDRASSYWSINQSIN